MLRIGVDSFRIFNLGEFAHHFLLIINLDLLQRLGGLFFVGGKMLRGDEIIVSALLFEECFVGALLDNFTARHDDDVVGVSDGR